ncbi:MAG: hypothetical protein V1934_05470 [Methanobacteriota archaeon]
MEQKKTVGMVLALVGGVLLILAALVLPAFASLDINADKIDTSALTAEQQDLLVDREGVTSQDLQDYMDEVSGLNEVASYKDTIKTVGLLMTVFMWITVVFGILAIVVGLMGKRFVRIFGTTGLSMGAAMAVAVVIMPQMTQDYVSASLGIGPMVAIVAGVLIIVASYFFPKKSCENKADDGDSLEAAGEHGDDCDCGGCASDEADGDE